VIFIAFLNSGGLSFYTDSLLDTAFVMWCKVVVYIKCTGFKGYWNAGF